MKDFCRICHALTPPEQLMRLSRDGELLCEECRLELAALAEIQRTIELDATLARVDAALNEDENE